MHPTCTTFFFCLLFQIYITILVLHVSALAVSTSKFLTDLFLFSTTPSCPLTGSLSLLFLPDHQWLFFLSLPSCSVYRACPKLCLQRHHMLLPWTGAFFFMCCVGQHLLQGMRQNRHMSGLVSHDLKFANPVPWQKGGWRAGSMAQFLPLPTSFRPA